MGAVPAALFGCFGYDEEKGGDRAPEIIPDGDTGGLTLGFSDGYTEEKATPETLDNTVAELLKQEFANKAELQ